MRLLATLALAGACVPGCLSFSVETNERDKGYDATWTAGKVEGKKAAVAAFVPEKGLTRDQWWRRKVTAMIEGVLLGAIPFPWDLRLCYSPAPITDVRHAFPAAAADPILGAQVAEVLKARGFAVEGLDAAAAADPQGQALVQKLCEQAKSKRCDLVYLVSVNEFTELRFKHDETQNGEVLFHDVATFTGNLYIPSTAVYDADGNRLLVRAREFERMFYTPLLMWGWMTPFSDQDGYDRQVAWLEKLAAKTGDDARRKLATYVVERDFNPAPKKDGAAPATPTPDAPKPEATKTAAAAGTPATRG